MTPIDIVAVDRAHVSANIIADFAKAGGDRISYGAFAKGGGTGALFERNLVRCAWRHRGGTRVGLSLGGGGTGPGLCRNGTCQFEQSGGILRGNHIMDCSDEGIYLRGADASVIERNSLRRTAGIQSRFDSHATRIEGNRID